MSIERAAALAAVDEVAHRMRQVRESLRLQPPRVGAARTAIAEAREQLSELDDAVAHLEVEPGEASAA